MLAVMTCLGVFIKGVEIRVLSCFIAVQLRFYKRVLEGFMVSIRGELSSVASVWGRDSGFTDSG